VERLLVVLQLASLTATVCWCTDNLRLILLLSYYLYYSVVCMTHFLKYKAPYTWHYVARIDKGKGVPVLN
jgi:hypothetical protein